MNAASADWKYSYHFVIQHPSEARALLLQQEGGWALPRLDASHPTLIRDISGAVEAFQAHLGIQATVLRSIYLRYDRDRLTLEAAYEMENHDPRWQPPDGARWAGKDELEHLPLTNEAHRAMLEAILTELESGVIPVMRSPWSRKGWLRPAIEWISDELGRLGYAIIAPIEQAQVWSLSCVLRARTARGNVYFKQAAAWETSVNEPVVTRELSRRFPGLVPTPLAIDAERRWMLLEDLGQTAGRDADIETRVQILRQFGAMQIASASQVDELLEIGLADRRLDVVPSQLDAILSRTDAASLSLNDAELGQLRGLAPRLKEMCVRLADYNVPQTLVHGDLHTHNVAFQDGRAVFFDWTDACITHPFLDVITMLFLPEHVASLLDARSRIIDAYLSLWIDYEPMERLREAWALAEPLGNLHQAISNTHIATIEEPGPADHIHGGSVHDDWKKMLAFLKSGESA